MPLTNLTAFLLIPACHMGGVKSPSHDSADWYPADTSETTATVDTTETGETGEPGDTGQPDLVDGEPAWVLSSLTFEVFLEDEALNQTVDGWLRGTMPPVADINIILWIPDPDFDTKDSFQASFGVGEALGGGDYGMSDASNPIEMEYAREGQLVYTTEKNRTMRLADVGGFGFEILLYQAGIRGTFSNGIADMEGEITGCLSKAEAEVTPVMNFGTLAQFMDERTLDCSTSGFGSFNGWSMVMAYTAWCYRTSCA